MTFDWVTSQIMQASEMQDFRGTKIIPLARSGRDMCEKIRVKHGYGYKVNSNTSRVRLFVMFISCPILPPANLEVQYIGPLVRLATNYRGSSPTMC
jgi:hypothetical protein